MKPLRYLFLLAVAGSFLVQGAMAVGAAGIVPEDEKQARIRPSDVNTSPNPLPRQDQQDYDYEYEEYDEPFSSGAIVPEDDVRVPAQEKMEAEEAGKDLDTRFGPRTSRPLGPNKR